jgi:hypothetical protein
MLVSSISACLSGNSCPSHPIRAMEEQAVVTESDMGYDYQRYMI